MRLIFWGNEVISELKISNENVTMKISIIILRSIRLYRVFYLSQPFCKHINPHKPCKMDNMLYNKPHFTDEATCALEVQSSAAASK